MCPLPALSPDQILEGASFAYDLWKELSPRLSKIIESKSDRYLNYDPAFLLSAYAAEHPIATGITYTELLDFTSVCPMHRQWQDSAVVLRTSPGPFRRASGTRQWQDATAAAFAERKKDGRTRLNERTIRVSNVKAPSDASGEALIQVQQASYYDQAQSNLILDFDRHASASGPSLRNQLHAQYGDSLPPLRDRRLANTLGIAAQLFYWNGQSWVPYIVRRVKKIGVFPGGLHCTASGVANWPQRRSQLTFQDLTNQMYGEIDEEVGLKPEDIVDLRPMALCREMARGGKPQIFFAGLTSLNRASLADRRRQAAKVVRATTKIPEIERDRWYRSADVVMTPSSLRSKSGKWGLTLEAAGALYYGVKYLKSRLPELGRGDAALAL
jgi:hypothetical protein